MNASIRALALALIVLSTSCTAQNPPAETLEVEGGLTKNFGTVTHKDRLEHNFILRNKGNDTIRITNVKAACGCTAVMVSGSTVPPAGSATVSVQFTPPRTTNGHVSKSVSVYAEGTQRPVYVLRIEADVQSAFESDPALVDLGKAVINKEVTASFSIKNTSGEKQSIAAVQSALAIEYRGLDGDSPPEVRPIDEVVIDPKVFELEPGAAQTITVRFTATFGGKVIGSVVLYAPDETRQVEFAGTVQRAHK